MNWDAISAVAELAGAIGMVASLFYLGAQIRQNTRTVRTASYHALVTNLANLASDVGRDGDAADLLARGQSDLQSLTTREQVQFGLLLQNMMRNFENIFYQFNEGMIDDVVWQGWRRRILRYYWQPGVQEWWLTWRDDCHPDFRTLLEGSSPPSGAAVPLFLGDHKQPE